MVISDSTMVFGVLRVMSFLIGDWECRGRCTIFPNGCRMLNGDFLLAGDCVVGGGGGGFAVWIGELGGVFFFFFPI